uniref:Ribonuclease P n=1 Tax=Meloidogyne hapla TaxID=6305 RepID=A0A1I8AXK5_MELHA
MNKKRRKRGGTERGKLYKLVMNLEFASSENVNFGSSDFEALVDSAIRRVLGESASLYQFLSYDVHTKRGSLLLKSEDLHLIWAALTIYGVHFEQKIALHFYSVLSQ